MTIEDAIKNLITVRGGFEIIRTCTKMHKWRVYRSEQRELTTFIPVCTEPNYFWLEWTAGLLMKEYATHELWTPKSICVQKLDTGNSYDSLVERNNFASGLS